MGANSEASLPGGRPDDSRPGPGQYAYCIIECETPRSFGRIGIGGRGDEVHTVHYGDLAAVVSDTPIVVYDPTRENVLAHERVNEAVMREFTVIPMSFGTVFRTREDVIEFLKDTARALRDVLQKMKDRIEFGLKVNWEPASVLAEIERENEEIRRLKEAIQLNRLGSTYFARLQLGRLVERAMADRAEAYVREINEHLRDCATGSRHNKTVGEKMILNAAFLVERNRAEEFDLKVAEIAERFAGKLRFSCTGPWPPYNFVNVRLKLERAESTS